jgi:hypothetical protein
MAEQLGLKKCWFHKNHYDIPKKRIKEIKEKCQVVLSKEIVEIIQHPEYAETILSGEGRGTAVPQDNFLKAQFEYHGTTR